MITNYSILKIYNWLQTALNKDKSFDNVSSSSFLILIVIIEYSWVKKKKYYC